MLNFQQGLLSIIYIHIFTVLNKGFVTIYDALCRTRPVVTVVALPDFNRRPETLVTVIDKVLEAAFLSFSRFLKGRSRPEQILSEDVDKI